jgi:hypothetical protein
VITDGLDAEHGFPGHGERVAGLDEEEYVCKLLHSHVAISFMIRYPVASYFWTVDPQIVYAVSSPGIGRCGIN